MQSQTLTFNFFIFHLWELKPGLQDGRQNTKLSLWEVTELVVKFYCSFSQIHFAWNKAANTRWEKTSPDTNRTYRLALCDNFIINSEALQLPVLEQIHAAEIFPILMKRKEKLNISKAIKLQQTSPECSEQSR